MEIITREKAKERGLKRYYTGKPCKRGHVGERLVSTRACVICAKEKNRKWREANPEKSRENARKWHAANVEKSREKNREKNRKWREANSEKHHALLKEWVLNNPEQKRVNGHKRRARLRNAPGSHTAQDARDIYARQQGRCAYCKVEVGKTWHLDHVYPLSKGGSNGPENLQVLCPSCNQRKHAKLPEEFAKQVAQELELQPQNSQEPPLSPAPRPE